MESHICQHIYLCCNPARSYLVAGEGAEGDAEGVGAVDGAGGVELREAGVGQELGQSGGEDTLDPLVGVLIQCVLVPLVVQDQPLRLHQLDIKQVQVQVVYLLNVIKTQDR